MHRKLMSGLLNRRGLPTLALIWLFLCELYVPAWPLSRTPEVSFQTHGSEFKENSGTGYVNLVLSQACLSPVKVAVSVQSPVGASAATAGQDFTAPASPVTIPAGALSVRIPVAIINDTQQEANEYFDLGIQSVSSSDGAVIGAIGRHRVCIIDDDSPAVSFGGPIPSEVNENGGTINLPIQLSKAAAKPVDIYFEVTGSALEGSDFTLSASPLTLAAGQTSGKLSLQIVDDDKEEQSETVVVRIVNVTGGSIGSVPECSVTIKDNEPPTIQFMESSARMEEQAASQNVMVEMSRPVATPISFTLDVSGTAKAGGDYTLPVQPYTFPAGTTRMMLPVQLIDDMEIEEDETVQLKLKTDGKAAKVGENDNYTLTVVDNDVPAANFAVDEISAPEAAGGDTVFLQLTHPATDRTSVTLEVDPASTAIEGKDYKLRERQIIFLKGELSKVVHLDVIDDTEHEGREDATIRISDTGARAVKGLHDKLTLHILDDDQMPPKRLSLTGRQSSQPDVAIDGSGYAHVVWRDVANKSLWYCKLDANGTIVTSPTQVYKDTAVFSPRVAADRRGTAHVVFMKQLSSPGAMGEYVSGAPVISYLRITSGSQPQFRAIYPYGTDTYFPYMAFNSPIITLKADGTPVIASEFYIHNSTTYDKPGSLGYTGVVAVTINPDATDAAKVNLSRWNPYIRKNGWALGYPTDVLTQRPEIAIDETGRMHCAWLHHEKTWNSGDYSIGYACNVPNYKWIELGPRDASTRVGSPVMTPGPRRGVVVGWITRALSMASLELDSLGRPHDNGRLVAYPSAGIKTVSDEGARAIWPAIASGPRRVYYTWVDTRTTSTLQRGPQEVFNRTSDDLGDWYRNISQSPAGANYVRTGLRNNNSIDYVWSDSRDGGGIFYRTWSTGGSVVARDDYDPTQHTIELNARVVDPFVGEIAQGVDNFQFTVTDVAGRTLAKGSMRHSQESSVDWVASVKLDDDLPVGYYFTKYQADYTLAGGRQFDAWGQGQFTVAGRFDLKGVVNYKPNNPTANSELVGDATVKVGDFDGNYYYTAQSNSKGEYELKSVSSAKAMVARAEKAGYSAITQGIDRKPDEKSVVIDLTLTDKTGKPVVTGGKMKYEGIFFSAISRFANEYSCFVNWGDNKPDKIEMYVNDDATPFMTVPGKDWGGKFAPLSLGTMFPSVSLGVPNKLRLVAIDAKGLKSDPFNQKIQVIPPLTLAGAGPLAVPYDFMVESFTGPLNNEPVIQISHSLFKQDKKLNIPLLDKSGPNVAIDVGFLYKYMTGKWEAYLNAGKPEGGEGAADDESLGFKVGKMTGSAAFEGRVYGQATMTRGVELNKIDLGGVLRGEMDIWRWSLFQLLPQVKVAGEFLKEVAKSVNQEGQNLAQILDSIEYIVLKGFIEIRPKVAINLPWKSWSSLLSLDFKPEPGIKAVYNPKINEKNEISATVGGQASFDMTFLPAFKFNEFEAQMFFEGKVVANGYMFGPYQFALLHWSSDSPQSGPQKMLGGRVSSSPLPWHPVERTWLGANHEVFLAGGSGLQKVAATHQSAALAVFQKMSAGQAPLAGAALPPQVELTLAGNVYPYSELALAGSGNSSMLLYVADSGSKANPTQFTDIHWTRFDGTNWTPTAAVSTNAGAEFAPTVAFDGNGDALALWERVKDSLAKPTSPDTMAPLLEIVGARWDHVANTWGPATALTNNTYLDHAPHICGPMADGSLLAVWTANQRNLYIGRNNGTTSASQVLWAKWSPASKTWSAPAVLIASLTGRLSQALAGSGNKAVYAYSRDLDVPTSVSTDREVYACVWNGTSWATPKQLTSDAVNDNNVRAAVSPAGKVYLAWESGRNYVFNEDLVATATTILKNDTTGEDFTNAALTLSPGGNLVLTWPAQSTAGQATRYMVYDPATRAWSTEQTLFDGLSPDRALSPAWDTAGNLTMAYRRTVMQLTTRTLTIDGQSVLAPNMPTATQTNLGVVKRRLIRDVRVAAVTCDTTLPLPGQTVNLGVTLENAGDLPVSNVLLGIYNGDPGAGGTLLTSATLTGVQPGGESSDLTIPVVMPANLPAQTFYVMADPLAAITEDNEANNLADLPLSRTDLEPLGLGSSSVARDGSARLSVRIRNNGGPAAPATVAALRRQGVGGTPLATANVPALGLGESAEVAFSLPKGTIAQGTARTFVVNTNETAAATDFVPENNTTTFELTNDYTLGAAPPMPVNLVLNPTSVSVDEGGTATFQVSLDAQPVSDVTLAVTRASGDASLTVKSGATLTIPRTAWATPVTVTLQAAPDADTLNGTAVFSVRETSGNGIATATIQATERDSGAVKFVTDVSSLPVPEGGQRFLRIWLDNRPTTDVLFTVTRISGDTDLTVASNPGVLPAASWTQPVNVLFNAAGDADALNGTAVFLIHATNASIPDLSVTVRELDSASSGYHTVGGTLSGNTTWSDTSQDYVITSTVTVPAGMTLTIGPGVMVRQDNSSFNAFDVKGTLRAQNGARLILWSYSPYGWESGNRKNGITIESGGLGDFDRVLLQALEVGDTANSGPEDGSQLYWSAIVYALDGAKVTVRGCRFEGLGQNDGRVPVYGLRMTPGVLADVTDSTATTPAVRTAWRNLRAGIGWESGRGNKRVERCDFSNCPSAGVRIWGDVQTTTLTLNNPDNMLASHVGTALNVKSGCTLALRPGSGLRSVGDNWVTVESGGHMTANHANVDMIGSIQVNGRMEAWDSSFRTRTNTPYGWEVQNRRNGVVVGDGAVALFERVRFQTYDTNTVASNYGVDHDDQKYWATALFASGTGNATVRGCRFENITVPGCERSPVGLRMAATATVAVENSVSTTPAVRCSFDNYQAGVEWEAGTASHRVEASNFTRCDRNIRIWGDSTQNVLIHNPKMFLGTHSGAQLTIKNGARLVMDPGTDLFVRSWKHVIVESGAVMSATRANLYLTGELRNQGSLQLTSSTVVAQLYSPYGWEQQNRQNGIAVQSGGSATLRGCSLYFSETADFAHWDESLGWGEWSAMVSVDAGAAGFTITGCAFNHGFLPDGRRVPFGVRTATKSNWTLTNNVFAHNFVALGTYDLPSAAVVRGNDFRDATQYAIFNPTGGLLKAQDNYWGAPSGPAFMTNPGASGGRVSDNVDFSASRMAPSLPLVDLVPPATGQESNALTTQSTTLGAELFGLRGLPGNSEVDQISFRLNGAGGTMAWSKITNFRLALDANGDGSIGSNEKVLVGGPAVLTTEGSELLVTFKQPFTTPGSTSAGYVLLADFDGLASGDAFTVNLDERYLRTSLAQGIQERLTGVRHIAGSFVVLADPRNGQVADHLNGLPEQKNVDLFGFRPLGAGRMIERLDFQLSGLRNITPQKFAPRLYLDVNQNGSYDLGDTLVAGTPTAFTTNGTDGVISYTFANPALVPTNRGYLLVGDFKELMAGDSLTISLRTTDVDLYGSETVATGWTTPATHVVDNPILLAPSLEWTQPKNFGVVQQGVPLLGFQIAPIGSQVDGLIFGLSGIYGITASEIQNARICWDANANGVIDAGEPVLASGGQVAIQRGSGTISFTGPIISRGHMILLADFLNLAAGDELSISLDQDGVLVPYGWLVSGNLLPVHHVVGSGPDEGFNKNMKWTLTWRSPGGTAVSGRFNHAGNRVILGYDTGSAWVYDAASNTPLIMLKDHYDKVRYAGFSSDDSAAVTVSRDGAVYIWDIKTSGTLRSAMFSDLLVDYAVPSPDFRKLMVITQGKGMLLDIDTQQRLWEFTPGNATVNAIAYSPDGKWIALGSSDKRAYILNAATGVELYRFSGHSQGVTGVAFTGDGKKLMTASSDATVQLWGYNQSLNKWTVTRTISLSGQNAQGAAVTNDGKRVCMITGGSVLRIFDGSTGLELYQVDLNASSGGNWGGTLENVAFDDAGQRVLVASSGAGWCQTACFRVSDGAFLQSWGPHGRLCGDYEARPRASGDGSRIFYNTNWGMNMLTRQMGNPILRSPSFPGDRRFAINGDGSRLAWVQDGRIRVDSVSNGGFAPLIDQPFDGGWNNAPVSMTRDGGKLAIGDRLFSGLTGKLLANYATTDNAYPSAFSPDGTMWGFVKAGDRALVTMLTDDPNATLYNMMLTDPYTPFKMFYHPDGVRVGCVDGGVGVQMFDMDTYDPVGLYRFDAGNVNDAELSDDGSLLLMGGNNVVKLYEVKTGRVLRYFYPMHSSLQDVNVYSVHFAKNDTQIVIAWSYNYIEVYERSQAARLDVTPAVRTLAKGQSQAFRVELVYDDTTRRDLTPMAGQSTEDAVQLEVVPAGRATINGNVVTVAADAFGQFNVRARYREGGQTLVGEALVTVGSAQLLNMKADPDRMTLAPGIFRPIAYTVTYDDGYQVDVTPQVTLAADRPEDVEIQQQNVKVLLTAKPGQVRVTGTFRDPLGKVATAQTVISMFGPRTAWERYAVTGGGYGLSGAFSPDGTQFAAGSSSGAVNLYAVGATPTQYALRHVIPAHSAPIIYVGYLDGANTQIVTVGQDGAIRTWAVDQPSRRALTTYQHDAQVQCAAVDGGQRVAVIGDTLGRVSLVDLNAGHALWTVTAHTGATRCVALDGDMVLSGGEDGRLKVFNRSTGQVTATKTVHTKAIAAVGFLPLSGNVPGFYTLSEDKTLVRWTKSNLAITGKPYEYPSAPTAAAVVGTDLYVATSAPPATWIYNQDGLLLRWLEHPPAEGLIKQILRTPDGAYIVTGRATGTKTVMIQGGLDAGEKEVTTAFSSFQFWESGRGIYRGSLAHSFPMTQAHAGANGMKIFTQDPKRTMSWTLSSGTQTTGTRLMETGYFIAPVFSGMDFTANSSILATRVGVSLFMYDTVRNLLWKTLHTPGEGPFTISPGGTRMATADWKTRLWDLANLSMIDENPHLCSGFDFVGESTLLGAIKADKFLGVFDSRNIMVNGTTARHSPLQLYVNRAGDRAILISEEVRGDGFFEEKSHDYYAEIYDVKDLTVEPRLIEDVYLLTTTEDPFSAGPPDQPSFAIAVSDDASMALIGASGDRPVKLIALGDGSVIREFLPPSGGGQGNIGSASVEFLPNNSGVMIGWREGFAELWRRVSPTSLTLQPNTYMPPRAGSKPMAPQPLSADVNSRYKVRPGQTLWMASLANFSNGDTLNVTPSTVFSTSAPSAVRIDGSLLTISPSAGPQVVTITAQYQEPGQTLTSSIDLEIVGTPISITGINRAGYMVDYLDPGRKLYGDAVSTFTLPIPNDLLHQLYIRTRQADANVTGSGFLSFTVNQAVRVVVAVDARMVKPPAWLNGWTALPDTLASTDVQPTRKLYQNFFAAGTVTLGANKDSLSTPNMRMYDVVITSPDVGQNGSVVIRPVPPNAPWRLEGPLGLKLTDSGTTTITNIPTGSYLLTWLPLSKWDLPVPADSSSYLARNAQVTFSGAYTRQTGTVEIRTLPASAKWTLRDGDGKTINGTGTQTLMSVPTGTVTITWPALAGYDSPQPSPDSRTLSQNGVVSFIGFYLSQTDSVERNRAKIFLYLLGLADQEYWMDANSDGVVNITDAVYLLEHAQPETPNPITPVDNATGVDPGVTFDWSDSRYALRYDFYLWKQSAAEPTRPTAANLTISKYKPSQPLAAGTYYYWRVIAKNQFVTADSGYHYFKTR